jgi:hypothetical protein
MAGFSSYLSSALVFLTPSTGYSSLNLVSLFHPTRHGRGSPYRGFP